MPASDHAHTSGSPQGPAPIARLTGRLRWRLGLQRGLVRALVTAGVALAVTAILMFLVQRLVLPTDVVIPSLAGTALVSLMALVSGFFPRPQPIALAARIDVANDLHSDLGNALALHSAAAPTDAMAALAIARGLDAATRADWRLAAPWRGAHLSRPAATAGVGALLFVLVALFPPDVGTESVARAVAPFPEMGRPAIEEHRDVGQGTRDAVSGLKRELETAQEGRDAEKPQLDDRIAGASEAIEAIIDAVLDGEMGQEEAFARLGELEAELGQWQDNVGSGWSDAQARVAEAAEKRLADKRQASEALKDMLDALRKRAWQTAAEAAEQAADKLADGSLTKREREKLAQAASKLADELKSEQQRKKDALREEQDRLKSKEKNEPDRLTSKEKERLKELERELASLEREEKEISEAMRQLEKLAREYEDLARKLMEQFKFKGGSGGGGSSGQSGQGGERTSQQGGQGEGDGGSGSQQGAAGEGGEGNDGGGVDETLRRAAKMIRELANGEASSDEAREAMERIERVRDALKRGGQADQAAQAEKQGRGGQRGQAGASGAGEQDGRMQEAGAGQPGGQPGGQEDGQPGGQQGGQEAGQAGGQQGDQAAMGGGQEGAGEKGQPSGREGGQPGGAGGEAGQQAGGERGPNGGAMAFREGGDGDGNGDQLFMEGGNEGNAGGAMAQRAGDPGGRGASLGESSATGGSGPKVGTQGVGSGHDPNLLGERSELNGEVTPDFVRGAHGEGASTTNIVEVAAQRGFATAGYDEVLQDYRNVAEDALKRELIPAGKRGYVRRYFDLIKPR